MNHALKISGFIIYCALFMMVPFFVHADVCGQNVIVSSNDTNDLNSGSRQFLASSFTASESCTVDNVEIIGGFRSGIVLGNIQVFIYSDNSGVPNTSLGQGTNITPTAVAQNVTDSQISDFSGASVTVTSGTKYWVVLSESNIADSGVWMMSFSTAIHAAAQYDCGTGSWCTLNEFFGFTVNSAGGGGGGGTTTIATSTGFVPNEQEWLFTYGTFLFIFSVPFWERVFSLTKGRYKV